jgi:internalin A
MQPEEQSPVFISYSHKDKRWLERLQTMLAPLLQGGHLRIWDDTQIQPGAEWKGEIEKALAAAKAAVLLVSPDFLASKFIVNEELPPLLDAAQSRGVKILWIAVRPSFYEATPLERYQALNQPNRPLASFRGAALEAELFRICQEIKRAVNPK